MRKNAGLGNTIFILFPSNFNLESSSDFLCNLPIFGIWEIHSFDVVAVQNNMNPNLLVVEMFHRIDTTNAINEYFILIFRRILCSVIPFDDLFKFYSVFVNGQAS